MDVTQRHCRAPGCAGTGRKASGGSGGVGRRAPAASAWRKRRRLAAGPARGPLVSGLHRCSRCVLVTLYCNVTAKESYCLPDSATVHIGGLPVTQVVAFVLAAARPPDSSSATAQPSNTRSTLAELTVALTFKLRRAAQVFASVVCPPFRHWQRCCCTVATTPCTATAPGGAGRPGKRKHCSISLFHNRLHAIPLPYLYALPARCQVEQR